MQRKHKEQNGTTQTPTTTITSKTKIGPPKYQQQQAHRRLYQVVYEDLKGNHNRRGPGPIWKGIREQENERRRAMRERRKRETMCVTVKPLRHAWNAFSGGKNESPHPFSIQPKSAARAGDRGGRIGCSREQGPRFWGKIPAEERI